MIEGKDPFNDDDPMMIYRKILKSNIQFPSGFDSDAKTIIKHLFEPNVSKSYGNLKNGVKALSDIDSLKILNGINY